MGNASVETPFSGDSGCVMLTAKTTEDRRAEVVGLSVMPEVAAYSQGSRQEAGGGADTRPGPSL